MAPFRLMSAPVSNAKVFDGYLQFDYLPNGTCLTLISSVDHWHFETKMSAGSRLHFVVIKDRRYEVTAAEWEAVRKLLLK